MLIGNLIAALIAPDGAEGMKQTLNHSNSCVSRFSLFFKSTALSFHWNIGSLYLSIYDLIPNGGVTNFEPELH